MALFARSANSTRIEEQLLRCRQIASTKGLPWESALVFEDRGRSGSEPVPGLLRAALCSPRKLQWNIFACMAAKLGRSAPMPVLLSLLEVPDGKPRQEHGTPPDLLLLRCPGQG